MKNILDELKWRGLIYDIIDEENLAKRLNKKITVYCGFDPTADSMHIGSLVPIISLLRFRKFGHRVIFIVGGGTGLVGDPSGKRVERSMNEKKIVDFWVERFKTQIKNFIDPSDEDVLILNNYDWLGSLKAIDMWRDYGRHFPINYMLQKDAVKNRLENGLTYLEFSYMIMQSIDFLSVYKDKRYQCEMQIGGQDQWGNITAGMELIRRTEGTDAEVFGLTLPLITKADGTKFGKTESGAIWLDKNKTSPYSMYQFFINTPDSDVIKFLKYYTFLSEKEILSLAESLEKEPHLRKAQKKLAEEIVKLCHGQEELEHAITLTETLFSGDVRLLTIKDIEDVFKDVSAYEAKEELIIVDGLVASGLASSKREAREFIVNKAITVNGNLETEIDFRIDKTKAIGGKYTIIRRGKKKYGIIKHK